MEHLSGLTIYRLLWHFYIYAFVGWCGEVMLNTVETVKFVNRGFLNGPVCPVYEVGGVVMVVLLTPLANGFSLLFLGSMLLCSLLELVTGRAMKRLFHTTWWDYSDECFNLGGYVCLKFSLLWGLAGVLLMRVLHPMVADLVGWLPHTLGRGARCTNAWPNCWNGGRLCGSA